MVSPISESGNRITDHDLGLAFTPGVYEDSGRVHPIDVCLVCATNIEEDALQTLFKPGEHRPYAPSYRRFYRTRYRYNSQFFSIVACKSSDQGSLDMMVSLRDVYRHFRPTVTCLVGIAGGLTGDLRIGDVAVAKRVYWYERGKETEGGVSRELIPFTPDGVTLSLVDGIVGDMRRRRNDFLTALVPYGTGEKIVASELSEIREYLLTVDRKIGAVEMESGGFYRHFEQPEFRGGDDIWLVVKGLSDHADSQKGDADQPLAASNSIKAALHLSTQIIVERKRA